MTILLDIIAPIFGIIAFGYLATFTPVFDSRAANALASFVFYFAIPVLLFRNMAMTELPDEIAWGYLLSYYLGGAVLLATGMLVARKAFGARSVRQAIIGFGWTYGNTVLLGIPLVLTSLGDEAALPLFLLLAFHSTLFFTSMTLIIEVGRGDGAGIRQLPGKVVRGLGANPILIAMVCGIGFNLAGFTLPGAVDSWAKTMSGAALPCALFSIGASLRAYKLTGALSPAMTMAVAKLIAHPLIVWALATYVFSVPPLWAKVAIICAATPVGVNVYLFGERYGAGQAESAAAILISTVFSMLTLAVVLGALGVNPG